MLVEDAQVRFRRRRAASLLNHPGKYEKIMRARWTFYP